VFEIPAWLVSILLLVNGLLVLLYWRQTRMLTVIGAGIPRLFLCLIYLGIAIDPVVFNLQTRSVLVRAGVTWWVVAEITHFVLFFWESRRHVY